MDGTRTPSIGEAIATTLGRFAHDLDPSMVPERVSTRARHLMLDAIGCGLASRDQDFATRFGAAFGALATADGSTDGGGRSGVIGFDERLPLRDAMTFNGVLAHGLDYDDTHMAGVIHLSVGVLPAVLALAAHKRMSGASMLAAFIAGLECGARIASVTKSGFHARGFHPTGLVGAFSSTFACGRLLALDASQFVHAQGIALSLAAGNLQFLEDGAWTKRIHPGWASQAGYTAATFARHGVPGPGAPYTGRFGLFNAYVSDADRPNNDVSLATRGIDERGRASEWEIEHVAIKPFPMCHFVHAATDAAIRLHRAGIDPAAIRAIELAMPAGTVPVVCEPEAAKRRPASDYEAKFSAHYAVASGLLRGRMGLKELEPSAYRDPAALALMDRTTFVEDAGTTFPRHYTGEIRVTMDDGRVLVHREPVNRGHAERPLSNDEIADKFFENATLSFPRAHADAIHAAVTTLEAMPSVAALEDLLARGPSSSRHERS